MCEVLPLWGSDRRLDPSGGDVKQVDDAFDDQALDLRHVT